MLYWRRHIQKTNKLKSGFQITITNSIETFIEVTCNEINNEIEKTKLPGHSYLSVKTRKALQELQSRDDIVIKDADKGGAVIILDVEGYIKEAERQLHNTENYKRLITIHLQPTPEVNKIIKKVSPAKFNK